MKNKGFTLVELLIVMAIIGILIAIAIIGLGAAQADARNSARETSVKGIAGLLETYYGANGQSYPVAVGMGGPGTNLGLIQFTGTSGTTYTTNSDICKATIDPVESGNATFSGSTCSASSAFNFPNISGSTLGGSSSSTDTQYFYEPYAGGTPAPTGSTTSVTGYLIGACLENGTIFAYTSNGSNAPYTQNGPNSVKVGGNTYTCS